MARLIAIATSLILLAFLVSKVWTYAVAFREEVEPANTLIAESSPLTPPNVLKADSPVPASASFGKSWEELADEVAELHSDDQSGLDRLYLSASSLIQKDPVTAQEIILKSLARTERQTFETLFFAVSAWIRYSSEPTRVMESLISDHFSFAPSMRDEVVLAYGLRELRRRFEKKAIVDAPAIFIKQLTTLARTEKSLNISLEAIELLQELRQDNSIRTILESRSFEDREILQATQE